MAIPAQKREDARKRLLAALFVKAQNHGIDADELREDIAPAVIGKRLSLATAPEIVRLIEHVTKLYSALPLPVAKPACGWRQREPSPSNQRRGSRIPSPLVGEGKGEGEERVPKRYPSSRAGLVEELTDAARVRWDADFEKPLNEFVNHNRPARTHYKFLKITDLKALKNRLNELNGQNKT